MLSGALKGAPVSFFTMFLANVKKMQLSVK
jgi:hypothetical protein